ncbi:ATP-binding cassette domain-containing protein [Aestuariimicrobium soli]|uniref:ATP-binding cassette domain-containing protein n=1 Tax=Aestuariimicrobium soli TaxID=2035834 RepID=UPI003EC0B3BB
MTGDEESTRVVLRAQGLVVHGREAVDLEAEAGRVTLVVAPKGTGRTSLLLALAGRMAGVQGSVTVDDVDATTERRRYRHLVSVARAGEFVDLEPRLLVREAVVERSLIDNVRSSAGEWRFTELCSAVGEGRAITLPSDSLVESLDEASATVLAAILALLRPARVVVLDDVDARLTTDQWRTVHAALTALAEHEQCAIVCTSSTPAPPALSSES